MNLKLKKERRELNFTPQKPANGMVLSLDALQSRAPQRLTPLEFAQQGLKLTPTRAFSVAEAMIALLIGTIVLGFSAPMITKTLKKQESSDLQIKVLLKKIDDLEKKVEPEGMVKLFYNTNCPTGWSQIKANDGSSLDGHYIRLSTSSANIGQTLEPSLPNIIGGFPGVGNFYNKVDKYKVNPSYFYDLDINEEDLGEGKKRPKDAVFGAVYRINTGSAPRTGVKVYNGLEYTDPSGAERDDYFGFDASYYNPIYGAADDVSTSGVDESANEVRPKSVIFVACKKDK